MPEESEDKFRCVHCGMRAPSLYKDYGSSVIKLTKCESCGNPVDKYVEYDIVNVMIDLVIMSKEAQRHILYNTEFKSYWKLIIILMLLETYGTWRNESLTTVGVHTICDTFIQNITIGNTTEERIFNNNTLWMSQLLGSTLIHYNWTLPATWAGNCWAWYPHATDETDLFIWEKDFYIQFISIVCGTIAFLCNSYLISRVGILPTQNQAPLETQVKGFALANMSLVLTLPMLVWGGAAQAQALHLALVAAYRLVVFYSVFSVVFECHLLQSIVMALLCSYAKFQTTFHATPIIRTLVS